MVVGRYARHGMTGSRFYFCWTDMMTRCSNTNRKDWKNYGGRGIKTCKKWRSFSEFKRDMLYGYNIAFKKFGRYTTLERINNDIGYSKVNCRWIHKKMQVHNRRKMSSNKSGFIGVSIHNGRGGKWRARFMGTSLGLFSNPKDAFIAYSKAKKIWRKK